VTSRIHSILPRIALIGGLVLPVAGMLLLSSLSRSYKPPPGTDVFALAQGTWAWSTSESTCRTDPQTISFTPDRKGMLITLAHPHPLADGRLDSVAYYDILRVTRNSIRGALRGETRLTADSQPVVWDLVIESPDRFAWHRTDWAPWQQTRDMRRCPPTSSHAPS
jgi:hypothetical protein